MAGKKTTKPLLDFTPDPVKELKGLKVRSSLHEKLDRYGNLMKEVHGEKPEQSVIVDKILARFFEEDDAFKEYEKRKPTPAVQAGGGAPGG